MITPSGINYIQPIASQVCNCNKIGFDPNIRWNKVICTYKLSQGERMWKVQTGEWAPFWCTLLDFTQYDGKWFMPPIIVHQSKYYYQYIYSNIPLGCTVHHKSSGYIDREGWLNSMTQFSNVCGASPANNQTRFFNGHDSHFYDCSLKRMKCQNIHQFLLK